MRNVAVVLVVLVIGAVVWWKWPHSASVTSANGPANGPASSPAAAAATAPVAARAPSGVRRLDAEERRRLGQQIEAALKQHRKTAASAGTATRPALDEDPVLRVEDVGKPVKDALEAAIPLLAACYEKAGSAAPKAPLAQMTMISDPELGTVIDNAAVTDAEGKPLERSLDECLRDAIDSLALPPLGKPGKLPLQYSFRF